MNKLLLNLKSPLFVCIRDDEAQMDSKGGKFPTQHSLGTGVYHLPTSSDRSLAVLCQRESGCLGAIEGQAKLRDLMQVICGG